jgi:hypothetical protein
MKSSVIMRAAIISRFLVASLTRGVGTVVSMSTVVGSMTIGAFYRTNSRVCSFNYRSFLERTIMKKLESYQYVIVRVWLCKEDGGEDVGHVSLQTPSHYMSLWPGVNSSKTTKTSMLFEHRERVEFKPNYEADLKAENREPEFTCHLYSLDIKQMNNKFIKIKKETKNWSAAGNTQKFNQTGKISRSCSSAAREILIAGGIENLSIEGFTVSIMPSPHNVFTRTRNAKKTELEKYPITKKFDKENGVIFNPKDEIETVAAIQVMKSSCILS